MLCQAREAGIFEEKEHEMIRELLKLADRRAGSIMVPRRDVAWLDLDQPPSEHQKTVIESHHSRFPVGRGSLDNAIGTVQAKISWPPCWQASLWICRNSLMLRSSYPIGSNRF
jgi:putative hemolysin